MSAKAALKAAVSPWGHHLEGRFPFSTFGVRVDAIANGGVTGCDVLVLWGGTDIHPSFYKAKPHPQNQVANAPLPSKRDEMEWLLIKKAHDYGIPIIGVCRGAQMLCAYAGGSLYQHVDGHTNSSHEITTIDGKTFPAPGDHHQMMDVEGTDHSILAWATKNQSKYYDKETYYKATEGDSPKVEPEVVKFNAINALAVQPHPEWTSTDTEFTRWLNQVVENKLL